MRANAPSPPVTETLPVAPMDCTPVASIDAFDPPPPPSTVMLPLVASPVWLPDELICATALAPLPPCTVTAPFTSRVCSTGSIRATVFAPLPPSTLRLPFSTETTCLPEAFSSETPLVPVCTVRDFTNRV